MILLWDADSTLHKAARCSKEDDEEGFIRNLDEAVSKFDNEYQSIINVLEQNDIMPEQCITFIGGHTNFRYFIFPDYKKKRNLKPTPPILNPLKMWVIENYTPHISYGVETDDSLVSYWKQYTDIFGLDKAIIAANDKDYKQVPCWIFDLYYNRFGEITKIKEDEAILNYYSQFITGDRADEYNLIKGKSKRFVDKYLSIDMTPEEMHSKVKELYYEYYGIAEGEKMFYIAELLVTLRKDVKYLPNIEF